MRAGTLLLLAPVPALPDRLEAVLAGVGRCGVLVDVCADHGLVALAAVARGVADRAVAVELRTAPLALASMNLARAGLADRVLLVRGDGLAPIARADAVVIGGVGGDLAAQLLERAFGAGAPAERAFRARRVVVQPNRHSREVRAWARGAGFHLLAERAVAEREQLHLVLAFEQRDGADPAYGARALAAEVALGPLLLQSADPASRLFLQRELERLRAMPGRRPELDAAREALETLFGATRT